MKAVIVNPAEPKFNGHTVEIVNVLNGVVVVKTGYREFQNTFFEHAHIINIENEFWDLKRRSKFSDTVTATFKNLKKYIDKKQIKIPNYNCKPE